jgi:hypothetical protein
MSGCPFEAAQINAMADDIAETMAEAMRVDATRTRKELGRYAIEWLEGEKDPATGTRPRAIRHRLDDGTTMKVAGVHLVTHAKVAWIRPDVVKKAPGATAFAHEAVHMLLERLKKDPDHNHQQPGGPWTPAVHDALQALNRRWG